MRPLLLCYLLLMLIGCESSVDILFEPTELILTVIDDRRQALKGAQVILFDNLEELNQFKEKGDLTAQTPRLTDDQGQVVFSDLDEKLRYYFFVTFRDRARFLDLENFSKAYAYPGFLIKGSTTRATIPLEPADNLVVFYSLASNQNQLPITLFLEGDSVGVIARALDSPPASPNVPGTISFRLRDGITNWYGRSRLGCLWTGRVDLGADDNFNLQELTTCQSGAITFWTPATNNANLPISIELNDRDVMGTLTRSATQPASCFQPGGLSGSRPEGVYNYIARSENRQCVWTGTLRVIQGECTSIQLEPCN